MTPDRDDQDDLHRHLHRELHRDLQGDLQDDLELDAFLRGEDDLSALLGGVKQPEVPAELDARIHAQARAALQAANEEKAAATAVATATPAAAAAGATMAAANDTTHGAANDAPAARPLMWRLRTPLALAATLVIGVAVSLHYRAPRDDAAGRISDIGPQGAPAEAPEAMPATAPRPADAVPSAPAPAPSAPAAAPVVTAPAAAAPAPAPAFEPMLAPPVQQTPEVRAPAAPAKPAPAPVTEPVPAPAATNTVVVPGIRASMQSTLNLKRNSDGIVDGVVADDLGKFSADEEQHAQRWLAKIVRMLDRQREEDAVASWDNFRAAFPHYPVPEDVAKRIETARQRPVGSVSR